MVINTRSVLAIVTLVSITRMAAAEDTGAPVAEAAPGPTTQAAQEDKTAAAVKAALAEDRKARDDRKTAEARYQKEAITFSDVFFSDAKGTMAGRAVIPYRNGRKLEVTELYEAVDRPDLAATYRRRGRYVWAALGTSFALDAAALYFLYRNTNLASCSIGDFDTFSACSSARSATRSRNYKIAAGLVGGGLVTTVIAVLFVRSRNPASENAVHDLVDDHNAKLRQKHGLPTAGLRPRLQEVAVAPYAQPDGGGLAISGRF